MNADKELARLRKENEKLKRKLSIAESVVALFRQVVFGKDDQALMQDGAAAGEEAAALPPKSWDGARLDREGAHDGRSVAE